MSEVKWNCSPEQVPTRQLICKDIIDDEKLLEVAMSIAKRLVESSGKKDGEELALGGIGTGAFIAWSMAITMAENGSYVPAALYLINPPLRLPWACTSMPCILKDCSVHVLVDENSTYGPAWRYEISTMGPYACSIFDDLAEAAGYVVHTFKRR